MFSKKTVLIFAGIVLITVNIIFLSITSKRHSSISLGRVAISFVAPFQELVTRSTRTVKDLWKNYFSLVSVSEENRRLKVKLYETMEKNNRFLEVEKANNRLRELVNFKAGIDRQVSAAEVIGKGPSAWFKTLIIDKGQMDGLIKGLPVVLSQGIAGQIVEVSSHYSKIMLIIDRNSAVDALVQRTRARGVIKGASTDRCALEYVLAKHDVRVGDVVVSSGLDGVYPKGLRIGVVTDVQNPIANIFKEITVAPYVDFEKLEEVLVVLNPRQEELGTVSK